MPPLIDDLDALLRRAQSFDNDAVAALLTSQRETVVRLVKSRLDRRLAARVDVDDVVQDVWTTAIIQFPTYAKGCVIPFTIWVQHVTLDCLSRCHRTHLRTKKRSIFAEVRNQASDPGGGRSAAIRRARNIDDLPAVQCAKRELYDKVRLLIGRLPAADQEILRLRIIEQIPARDVADKMSLSTNAVWARQVRALRWLRERLGDEAFGGEMA